MLKDWSRIRYIPVQKMTGAEYFLVAVGLNACMGALNKCTRMSRPVSQAPFVASGYVTKIQEEIISEGYV